MRIFLASCLLFLCPVTVVAGQSEPAQITVAAYEFPPYYSSRMEANLLGDLVAAINTRQQTYRFTIREIRPAFRYQAITAEGCCTLMFFESETWGWQQHLGESVHKGPVLARGASRYVQRSNGQAAKVERIGGLVGYHYYLVESGRDFEFLDDEHGLYLADTHRTLINMLLGERLDMIMMTEEYLLMLSQREPGLVEQFAVIENAGTEYETGIILGTNTEFPAGWLTQQLSELEAEGKLRELFAKYGLQDNLIFSSVN